MAQTPAADGAARTASKAIEEIVIRARADSLVGLAGAAPEGTVGSVQLEQRPLSRPGEVLETVPGVIVTQHGAGAGVFGL
jgi:hypothetical protein